MKPTFFQRLRAAWSLTNWPTQNMLSGGGVSSRLQVPGIGRPAENILMVYAALKARCDAIKQVPLRASNASDQLIESGPLAALLEQPNSVQDIVAYIECIEGYLALYDEAFIAIVGVPGAGLELVPLHPRGMTPVDGVHLPTGTRIAMGWLYIDPFTGHSTKFIPEDIIAIAGFNPHAPLRGLGPDLAARRAFQADIAAREHNLGIFLNGGTPDVALETDQRWTREQVDEFMDFWNARYGGFQNAHKPAVLYGGLKVNKLGLSNADLQFLEGIRKTDQEILTAMRVYPAMVGLMTGETGLSQGSSTAEQKVAWWTDIGLPELSRIAGAHQRGLASRFAALPRRSQTEPGAPLSRSQLKLQRRAALSQSKAAIYFWFDENAIEALVEHRRGRLDQFDKLLARGYLPDDANAYFDLGLPEHPTNIGTLPIGLQAVTDLAPLPASSPSSGSAGFQPAAAGILPAAPAATEEPRACSILDQIREHLVSDGRAALPRKWQQVRKSLDGLIAGLEKLCAKKYSRFFLEQRDRVLMRFSSTPRKLTTDAPSRGTTESVPQQRASLDDFVAKIFPMAEEDSELLKRLSGTLQAQIEAGWNTLNGEIGLPSNVNPFTIDDPRVKAAVEARKIQCKKINATTEADLRKIIGDAFDSGATTTELGDAIAEYYGKQVGPDAARPQTAARTQVAGVVNDGRMAAAESVVGLKKGWLHGGSEHPRPSHLQAQADYLDNPIPLDEDFVVGGIHMSAPGADDAPIEEVANCTCVVVFSMS